MRIAHLSDLHVTAGVRLADQAADLERLVDRLLDGVPDLALLTGDLYGRAVPHRPTPDERAVLEPQIVRLAEQCPVVVLAGNHDHDVSLARSADLRGAYPIVVEAGARAWRQATRNGAVDLYALAYPTKRWLLAGQDGMSVEAAQNEVSSRLQALVRLWGAKMVASRGAVPQVFLGHVQVRGCRTSGGEVLAGQEIEISAGDLGAMAPDYGALGHLHLQQEVAPQCWYAGSPWPCDWSEGAHAHGALLVELLAQRDSWAVSVVPVSSGSRAWVTLAWRWAVDLETGAGRWVERPTLEQVTACVGCEVRCRVVVPDGSATSVPWSVERAWLDSVGPHRVTVERVIEPTMRVRSSDVVTATTVAEKVGAYWRTVATPPEPVEQAAALAALERLQTEDDERIAASGGW